MGVDSQDSKELWHRIHAELPEIDIKLGPAAAAAYAADPKMLLFMASRYKFVAKMLEGTQSVVEIGCGDAFGAPIVAQSVGRLLCTDIHEASLADNARRLGFAAKLEFRYFDFRVQRLDPAFDAAYAVDVLEHVYPAEEDAFLGNIARSLAPHGVALFGTPNSYSEQFASKYSKLGHVNLKDAQALRATMQRYFHVVFMFSMNDEVVHTGFAPMAHYLWALCVAPRAG
jgi:cyclopropane fatty-acyl-phospholipid synthase-like methyltransferase